MAGPEHELQEQMKEVLEWRGFDVTTMSQPKPFLGTPGIPDLYLRHEDRDLRVWLEVKTPSNPKPSKHQQLWHERERAAGGTVWVCKSLEELARCMRDAGFNIEID